MVGVYANGLTFHVGRLRSGPPGDRPVVVCVHGLAVVDNAATTFVLGYHLARHADVITYDLRGHGRSDRPPTGYGVADHATDLLALLDALTLAAPVHLVAFSYGGAIPLVAAMRRPERVASITLLDGLVPVDGWQGPLYGLVERYDTWAGEARAQGLGESEIEAAVVARVMGEYGLPPRRARAVTRRVRTLFAETTLREDLRGEPAYGPADFARIDCPVLGIYGDRSEFSWMAGSLVDLVPGTQIHTVHGADHLGVFWRLEETRPLVSRFLGLTATV